MRLQTTLLAVALSTQAFADDSAYSGFVEPSIHSQWRFGGLPFTETPVLQTKFVGCKNTTCAAIIPTYDFGTDELIETDYALLKILPFEDSTLVLGYGHYEIMGAPSTNEIFAEYERGPWKSTFFLDFDQGNNGWVANTTYTKRFGSLETKITGGINHNYYLFEEGQPKTAIYGNLTVGIPQQIGDWDLKPYVTKQLGQAPLDDELWAGVIAKYDF